MNSGYITSCSHICYHRSLENPRDCFRTAIVSHRTAKSHVELLYSFSYATETNDHTSHTILITAPASHSLGLSTRHLIDMTPGGGHVAHTNDAWIHWLYADERGVSVCSAGSMVLGGGLC